MSKSEIIKNKIEGTPILKLAVVKRFQVKKIFRKIRIGQKIRLNFRQKIFVKKIFVEKFGQKWVKNFAKKFIKKKSSEKSSKNFVKKIRQKILQNSSKIPRNPKEPKMIQILKRYQCFSLDHRERDPVISVLRSSARPA